MICDRTPRCFRRVRLRFGRGCSASFDHPPVIKHTRDMSDLGGVQFFNTAQRQIVILRTFITFTKTTDLDGEARADKSPSD